MARMRYIKPEFWTDSVIVRLSPWARLLYIGTWNFALCDHGHLEDDAFALKMKVFPADNVDVEAELASLITAGRISRLIGSDGRRYLHVVHLTDHQKTDPRFTPRCPACNDNALTSDDAPAETLPSLGENGRTLPNSPTLSNSLHQEGRGEEGRGEEGRGLLLPSPAAPSRKSEPPGFDDFWATYPRKVGKDAALKAWAKAIRRAPWQRIVLGAQMFEADPNLPDKQFIPHPATWLNDGRWDDEPLPHRPANGGRSLDPQADLLRQEMARAVAADEARSNVRQIGAAR